MSGTGMRMGALAMAGFLLATLAEGVTISNVIWSAGAGPGDPSWASDANWQGGQAPSNPTPAILYFITNGQQTASVMDADRSVGGLDAGLNSSATQVVHTLDLGGFTLTVTNRFRLIGGAQTRRNTLNVTNGTVRIGTAAVPGYIDVGAMGTLTFRPGSRLDPFNLHSLTLGASAYGTTDLDLRGVEIVGGTLRMRRLYMNGVGWYANRVLVDGATTVNTIEIAEVFEMGRANTSANTPQFIGNPADAFTFDGVSFGRLPAGISLIVGTSATARASMWLVEQELDAGASKAAIRAAPGGGGVFRGYLSTLRLAAHLNNGVARPRALLDLGAMDGCLLDIQNLAIATGRASAVSTDSEMGEMILPPGTATVATAVIGAKTGTGWGRLGLSNTLFQVTNSLTLNKTALVTIRTGSEPVGLDLNGTLYDAGGTIQVHFISAPLAATNWAVRVAGDARTALNSMVGTKRLVWSIAGSITGKKAGVVADESYTYFALVDTNVVFDPVAIAKNRTYEIGADNLVLVHPAELDNGSFDPENPTNAVQLRLVYAGGPETNRLEFTAAGDYPVTLVANILAGGEVTASATATATVSVVAPPAGTTNSVEWSGLADTLWMTGRREWFWSGNWAGGVPPANPTPGTILFRTLGQGVKGRVDADRVAAYVDAGQADFPTTNTVDLDGRTLTVGRRLRVVGAATSSGYTRTTKLVFENGTLQLGSTGTPADVSIEVGTTLAFGPGSRLNTVNLGTLGMYQGNTISCWLDLRGVEVVGGVLRANVFDLPITAWFVPQVYLDGATRIDTIEAVSALRLGRGNVSGPNRAYIGDPSNTFSMAGTAVGKLPAGISLKVGAATNRAELVVADGNAPDGDTFVMAAIKVVEGGAFSGWLTSLKVGTRSGTGRRYPYGILDLAAMTNGFLDAQTVAVAPGRGVDALGTDNERGELRLPPGTGTVGAVTIGAPAGVGFGVLETRRMLLTVTNTVLLDNTAEVTNRIGALSGGFDLRNPDPAAFTCATGAVWRIRFEEAPAARPHFGFRWQGDHVAALQAWRDGGRLGIDDAALNKPASIFYYKDGSTYIGLSSAPGSVIVIR